MTKWYEPQSDRLAEEIALMRDQYPDFAYELTQKGPSWTGTIEIAEIKNAYGYQPSFSSLKVRILCGDEFPRAFPAVEDVENSLERCPHVYKPFKDADTRYVCYSFGLFTELDFANRHHVVDLCRVLEVFLVKHSIYLETGRWVDGQPHLLDAFLLAEFNGGCIDPESQCPCRLNGKVYKDCHLGQVASEIERIAKCYGKRKLGRNLPCACGSGIKLKKCCLDMGYYGVVRRRFIQQYPEHIELIKEAMETLA